LQNQSRRPHRSANKIPSLCRLYTTVYLISLHIHNIRLL
jgi:hypothetical protein